ncbi:SET domain-containing protein [Abeliophyllum distichum]|uniref:SET domain-containing protein n=1 Tax=Abeliophyllum distichum TaxID=126358 RepID=A0ABD1VR69_9LAMI
MSPQFLLPPEASHYIDEECDDFLMWLEHKAVTKISSVLSIGKSAYGRSLYASKYIRTWDCILKVPYSAQLSKDNLLPDIASLLGSEVGNVAKVALLILYEQKLGQNSEWFPYISRLPQPADMHSAILWGDDELEMIRPSALYEETTRQKAQIEKDFWAVKVAFDHFPHVFRRCKTTGLHICLCFSYISCMGKLKGCIHDFLNHGGTSQSCVLSDEGKQHSEVIADCDYAPGDQVLIRYGKFSNATLLLDFGFTLPHNIYDQVQIELNVPHHDQLCAMKLELLHRYRAPSIKDVNGFSSSGNCFTIKEVRAASRRGRGIPQSLRAFGRILSSDSQQELNALAKEAEQHDGRLARYPLKNKKREIEAHQLLHSKIAKLIEEYDTFIKSLGSMPLVFGKGALRRQETELLVLRKTMAGRCAYRWRQKSVVPENFDKKNKKE